MSHNPGILGLKNGPGSRDSGSQDSGSQDCNPYTNDNSMLERRVFVENLYFPCNDQDQMPLNDFKANDGKHGPPQQKSLLSTVHGAFIMADRNCVNIPNIIEVTSSLL